MKDYWKRCTEMNINHSRAGKPPLTHDECWKIVLETCAHACVSGDRLFAGTVYVGMDTDLEEKFKTQKKELGALKQDKEKLTSQLKKAEKKGGGGGGAPHQAAGGNPRGGNPRGRGRGSRGDRGGRGGGNVDNRMGLGMGRTEKLKLTCEKYNKGENCTGCSLQHKCSKEETYGR